MSRQRTLISIVAKQERKFEFFQAIFECQVGPPRIDFEKLALRLGYKNERCAADSYYRFCREHLKRIQPGSLARGGAEKYKRTGSSKQTYDLNGAPTGGFQDDDEEDESEAEAGEFEMGMEAVLNTEARNRIGARAETNGGALVKQEFPVWNLDSFFRSAGEVPRETPVVVVKDEEDQGDRDAGVVAVKKESVPEIWKW